MSNKVTTHDLTEMTDMIDAAMRLQHEGKADVFIDWMGHFGELELRVYPGKWAPETKPHITRYHCRMTETQKTAAQEEFYAYFGTFYTEKTQTP